MSFAVGVSTELDALGDELLMDDDSSYLDEAATAPSIPEGLPGDKSVNRVLDNFNIFQFYIRVFSLVSRTLILLFVFQDGVLVDEFGLPQIPAT